MRVEILTIGDEILSGNVLDTNTNWLADRLWLEGFDVSWHSTVRDDEKDMAAALKLAADRAGLVLVTGGLGPTADDFTIEVAAKTFRRKLVEDPQALKHLQNFSKSRKRDLGANDRKQALIPEGARSLPNPLGTAPGVACVFKKVPFYFMPGVPSEMKGIFSESILPEILKLKKDKRVFASVMLKCFGRREADLDAAMADLFKDRLYINQVRVGFRAHYPETFIKLSAWALNAEKAQGLLAEARTLVTERVGETIYGEGADTLESVVGKLLEKSHKTLAVAESCSGGLLANRITNIPGASSYFKGGVVSYSNESKQSILGVSPETIRKQGAVSSSCAREMAQGVRRVLKADFGVALTGIAGPDGGTPDKPVGTVHLALATSAGIREEKKVLHGTREQFKLLVTSLALDWIRKDLLKN